jgi:hypothetical protein
LARVEADEGKYIVESFDLVNLEDKVLPVEVSEIYQLPVGDATLKGETAVTVLSKKIIPAHEDRRHEDMGEDRPGRLAEVKAQQVAEEEAKAVVLESEIPIQVDDSAQKFLDEADAGRPPDEAEAKRFTEENAKSLAAKAKDR